jgi:hypothetical protein
MRKRLKISATGGKTLPGTRIREMQQKYEDRLIVDEENEKNCEEAHEIQNINQNKDDNDFLTS